MAPSLLQPPGQLSPADALRLSQRAPRVLENSPSHISSSPLTSPFSASESAELWINYENLFLSCIRTGDNPAAHECLERLIRRFGDDNERVMAFKGLLKEADASNSQELDLVLKEYDEILSENSTNIVRPALRIPSLAFRRSADWIVAHHQAAHSPTSIAGARFRGSLCADRTA
jgi:ER membrane protein complex subunit 2